MRILFVGSDSGTTRHRFYALRRLGHSVNLADPWGFVRKQRLAGRLIAKLIYEVGAMPIEPLAQWHLRRRVSDFRRDYDLVWVDHGELLGPSTVRWLRSMAARIVNYNVDDPFGARDKRRFTLYRRAVHAYDLVVVVREENVKEARDHGAQSVLRVFRSADEVAHAPVRLSDQDHQRWASEVAFIGTWMPERGPFLLHLVENGVPLSIWGDRWQKAPEWSELRGSWRGPSIFDRGYVKVIQSAKVCLGLLSKGNRDQHTQRSSEIPFCGGLLCAERTKEHLMMYRDGDEAVFWDSATECVRKVNWLLDHRNERIRIARAGQARCRHNGHQNEKVLTEVLSVLEGLPKDQQIAFGARS